MSTNFMNKGITNPQLLSDPQFKSISETFETILNEAILGNDYIKQDSISQFIDMIQTQQTRQIFIHNLNTFRINNNCALQSTLNYTNLCKLMINVLDISYKQMDVFSAMKILIFSNTFYLDNSEDDLSPDEKGHSPSNKFYLQNGVAGHLIWHDLIFWEKAIYECISEEIKEQKQNNPQLGTIVYIIN